MMREFRRNAEGYSDPTACAVFSRLEREHKKKLYGFVPIAYICAAGACEHTLRRYCSIAMAEGRIPLAPQLLFDHETTSGDEATEEKLLYWGLILQSFCQEVWCFGSERTLSLQKELHKAKQRNLKIRFFNDNLVEVRP